MTIALSLSAARFWRDYPREALALGTLGVAAAAALAGAAYSTPTLSGLTIAGEAAADSPPAPPPLLVRQLPPGDALSINQAIPLLGGPIRFAVGIWTLIAGIIALRQALDVTTGKAVLTAIVATVVLVALTAILGVFGMAGMVGR